MMTTHILVVDDDAGVRFFLQEALTRDGHHVTAVESGQAALDQLRAQAFDLALLDLKLRDMSGLTILTEMRHRWPGTVAIMLTAHSSLESAVEALRQGAHDYLFKPCKTVEIRESVRSGLLKRQREVWQHTLLNELERHLAHSPVSTDAPLLAKPTPPPPLEASPDGGRFLHHGPLVIDLMRHVITFQGQLLELSPTEFALLAYLVSVAPRVVSQQELVREVQGYHCEPQEARETLRFHIYRLRQKLHAVAKSGDVIHTVRGVGYALNVEEAMRE